MTQDDGDLREQLRRRLGQAMRDRDRVAKAALRDAIAALDNAEAVDQGEDVTSAASEYVAGGVVGLGAAEAERRVLDLESQRAVLRADMEARLGAAATYEHHGHGARGARLRVEADVLRAVLEAAGIKNILTKSMGSSNHIAVVHATLNGLLQLRLAENITKIRSTS